MFYYWQSLPGSASRLSLQLESTFNFMANYKILLRDNSNPDNNRNQYSAEQFANNELEAKEEIKLFYSQELDTNTDQIEVLSIVKL